MLALPARSVYRLPLTAYGLLLFPKPSTIASADETRVYLARSLHHHSWFTTERMGRTQRRLLRKTESSGIDSSLDARLRLLAVGQLDRKSRDQLFIELAKNPGLVDRLAEHLRALSPL